MKHVLIFVVLLAVAVLAQSNVWTKAAGRSNGNWAYPGLAYSPVTREYILSMGWQPSPSVYSVQVYTHELGKWINALPSDTLYGSADSLNSSDSARGKWADSTGVAYGYGYNKGIAGFGWRPGWRNVKGYLRPNTSPDPKVTRAYSQFCVNSDDGKIYYFMNNQTFTYNPVTRIWDTLSVPSHPNGTALPENGNNISAFLKWGALCYDATNKEIVLFGGGGLDTKNGSPGGTWTFKPSTKVWTKLNLSIEPTARAHSPMAYDSVNRCIVMFGGERLDAVMNDTWVYDCVAKTWAKKNPSIRPKPRAGHSLLYLSKSRKIVLLGGYRIDVNQSNDFEMWVYDVAANSWSLLNRFNGNAIWPKLSYVRPAFCGIAVADKGDTIIALGDSAVSMYGFQPQTYRLVCDPSLVDAQGTLTYGMASDSLAFRSGSSQPEWYITGVSAPDTSATASALRSLVPGTWLKLAPPKTPGGDRTWGTAVLDPVNDVIMRWSGGHAAYCGTDVPQYSIRENRWTSGYAAEFPLEYDADNECNPGIVTFNGNPFLSGHTRKCYSYDVNTKKMISVINRHTYLYDPAKKQWDTTHIHNAESYSADRNGGLCTTPHGAFGFFGSAYLFSADSLRWRKLSQIGTLPGFAIDACGLVYDSKRDRILYVHQNYGNTTTPARMYSYDFKTGVAAQLFPEDSSIATGSTAYRESAYLPNLDIVVFQIFKNNNMVAYDCARNRWFLVPVTGVTTPMTSGVGAAMAYDPNRDLVWLTDNASGMYVLKLDGAATALERRNSKKNYSQLILSPNPFNPAMTVSFGCSGNKHAQISVVDPTGRIVMNRKVALNGDYHTEKLSFKGYSSGLYVVNVEINGRVLTKRALCLK